MTDLKTLCISQAGLELIEVTLASASQVLGLKACAITPGIQTAFLYTSVMWAVLDMCCICWLMNKAVWASGFAE